MRQPTVKQLECQLERALKALEVGYLFHQEYRCTEQGGKVILGRHVGVYVSLPRLSRADRERVARVFRRLWHRRCRVHSINRVSHGGCPEVQSTLTLTF